MSNDDCLANVETRMPNPDTKKAYSRNSCFLLSLRRRVFPSPRPEAERLFLVRNRCKTLRNNTHKSRTTLAVRFYCSYPAHTQADLRQRRKSARNKLALESDRVR